MTSRAEITSRCAKGYDALKVLQRVCVVAGGPVREGLAASSPPLLESLERHAHRHSLSPAHLTQGHIHNQQQM